MEDKYHEAEEERINQQVTMEMELEKKQSDLEQACKDLQRIQKEVIKVDSHYCNIYLIIIVKFPCQAIV